MVQRDKPTVRLPNITGDTGFDVASRLQGVLGHYRVVTRKELEEADPNIDSHPGEEEFGWRYVVVEINYRKQMPWVVVEFFDSPITEAGLTVRVRWWNDEFGDCEWRTLTDFRLQMET